MNDDCKWSVHVVAWTPALLSAVAARQRHAPLPSFTVDWELGGREGGGLTRGRGCLWGTYCGTTQNTGTVQSG
jgi:hypothetical protein